MSRTSLNSRRTRTSCSILALATVMAIGATPAAAQSFNGTGVFNSGSGTITTGAGTTNIALTANNSVITWTPTDNASGTGTNILFQNSGTTATFSRTSDFAVLNKIMPTDITRAIVMNGTVNSRVNGVQGGSVYFYSPSGFVLGGTSVFSVGSLVVTASPITVDGSGNFISNVGTDNNVIFGQAPNANATIVSGGTISANRPAFGVGGVAGDSYVALVAPHVVHTGSISVNGSAALVAAEAATISFSTDGLFDIQVTAGTTSSSGLDVTGDIGGPTPVDANDKQGIYLVAVPKNQLLTMVIGQGADLGFTLANTAVDDNGVIVLSAGNDIVNGAIGAKSAAPGTGTASFWFTGAHATNNLIGEATGDAYLYSTAPSQLTTIFNNDVTVHADNIVSMQSSGAGASLTVGGNLSLSADRTGTTGQSVTAGNVSLFAQNGGTLSIAGTTDLSADGTGGNASSGTAGSGTGGSVAVFATDGSTLTLGNITTSAVGTGGNGLVAGVNAGNGTGGDVQLYARNSGAVVINTPLLLDARGIGGNATGTGLAGNGTGGVSQVDIVNNASLTINGALSLLASGLGGAADIQGGSGTGGVANIGSDLGPGGGSTMTVNGNTSVVADGEGGSATSGSGGVGTGGDSFVGASANTFAFNGNLDISASGRGGASGSGAGGGAVGGTAALDSTGANIHVTNVATVAADASAGDGGVGGDATGGYARIVGRNIDVDGTAIVTASGDGGFGFNADGGDGEGGLTSITAQGGNLNFDGAVFAFADGTGGGSQAFGARSGDGTGGSTNIVASANSGLTIDGAVTASANGQGGGVGFLVNSGDGFGGTLFLQATGTNAALSIGGNVGLTANGQGGFGFGDCLSCGGQGGDGFGGDIHVNADGSGASLGVQGSLDARAQGFGSDGIDADGGYGEGGVVQISAGNGGVLNFADSVLAYAYGAGGWRDESGYGGDLPALAGDGVGGFVELFTYGSGAPDINVLSYVDLEAEGIGGGTNVVGGFGGNGTGGIAWLDAQTGTIDISDGATVMARGRGGDSGFGTGGDGTGRNAEIDAFGGGAITIGGDGSLVSVDGIGGDGLQAGTGTGGGIQLEDGSVTDGAHLFAQNGSISISGTTFVDSRGFGGFGYDGGFELAGGVGGDAIGGAAFVTAANSNAGPSSITLSTLNIDVSATGRDGGQGGGGNQGGDGGAGGSATGGVAGVTAQAGNGHLTITTVNASAIATGGNGGDGGNGDGLGGGNGGAGGDAEGGFVTVGTASGNAAVAAGSNLGTANFGSIIANASATGGDGGNGNFGSTNGSGGDGGTGDGGAVTLLARGSTVTVTGTTQLIANGTGGDGGSGGGETGTAGAGANGFAGEIKVLSSARFLIPAQHATLNTGAIIGTATGEGGLGSTNGLGIVEGGSSFNVDQTTANIGSLSFTVSGDSVDPGADESRIAITNSTVNVTGQFGFSTDGDLSFYIDNGSLTADSLALHAGNFVTDTVNAAPVNRGTAFANDADITSGGDFIADANFDITNTFVVDVPGSIRVGSVHDDNSIDFSAGGTINIDGIDAGGFLDLFADGAIDTDDIDVGNFVVIHSVDGSIGVGNISAGSNVALIANTFIAGEDISTFGSISAQTASGDINLENLTSTFGTITLDAGSDIFLAGDVLADGDIELTADGNILMNNATSHHSIGLDAGGYIDGDDFTAGDSINLLAGGLIDVGNLSAGLVNASLEGDYEVMVAGGSNITALNIDAAGGIGLAAPGTITAGDINAGGIFMALAHGDMLFGDATASEVFLADYAMFAGGGGGIAGACVGSCGTASANGVVTNPPTGTSYTYVTTDGGTSGAGQLPGVGGTNGSDYTTSEFSADAGSILDFWFNYVTSDGSGFADYAWASLLTSALDPVAILFTARTQESGTIVPGQGLPGVEATLNPASVPIIDGAPVWEPLGADSGACFAAGCGFTGWINSTYEITEAGNYVLRFGVSNWTDTGYQSGMAFSGITVGGVPVETGLIRTGGSITIGNVDTGKFTAAAGTTLTTGIIDSTGSIELGANGAISTGNLTAGDFVLGNGGSITTGNIDADSVDMTSESGNINTGNIVAFGAVEMDAFGDILAGDITAGSIDLLAGDDITTGDLTTQQLVLQLAQEGPITTLLFPGASITLESGGDITTGDIDSIDGVYANAGGGISTGTIDAVDFVELFAVDDILTGNVFAYDFIEMASSNGDIDTGNLTGSQIDLDAAGNIAFDDVDGYDFDFSAGGSVTGGNILVAVKASGDAGGNVTLGNITAGPLIPFEDFSVGIAAIGNISVGNVSGSGHVGFATQGNLTTGNLASGDLVMTLVGGNTTTGSITTGGEGGGQVYMADDSMFLTGGGTLDGEGDFDPSIVLNLQPVATGGSITINGPVNTGQFQAAAGTGLTTQAINAGFIQASAGGTATLNGIWSGEQIELTSNDIDISGTGGMDAGTNGEIFLISSNPTQMLIGDGLTGTGYALSNAEFGRLSGGDVTIVGRGDASAAIDMLIGDLTVTGPTAGSTIEDPVEGILAFAVGDVDSESASGVIRVAGDVNATGFGSGNAIEFYATRFELDAATGSISIFSSGNTLGGELGLYADRIHVAEGTILNQLASNPTYTGYQQDLNEAAAVQRPEGVLRADTLWIESDNLQDVLIQNTGTTAAPAGFLVREAFINDDFESAGPAGSINLVVNGQVVTEGGTLTGIEARDALVTPEDDITPFTANSTINGCPLSGPCIIKPPVPPTTGNVVDNQIDLITGNLGGESDFDDNQEGDEGSGNPISPPQPLFDTRPLIPSSDVNDPVSGTGNPALLGTAGECDDDDDQGTQCGTKKEDGQ